MSIEAVSGPPLTYPVQPIKPVVGKVGGPSWGAQETNAAAPSVPRPDDVGRLLDISV